MRPPDPPLQTTPRAGTHRHPGLRVPALAVLPQGRVGGGGQLRADGRELVSADRRAFAGARQRAERASRAPLMHVSLDGTFADVEETGDLRLTRAVRHGADNPFTQIETVGFHAYSLALGLYLCKPALDSGFATALGVQVGNPGKKVVALMGDGGFLYNVQELATMRQQHLDVVAIVFNDNAYGNVKRTQREDFAGHVIAADLANPDFVALAASFGIRGIRVHEPDALRGALGEALSANEPVLIEVMVGEMPSAWHLVGPGGGAYPVLWPS